MPQNKWQCCIETSIQIKTLYLSFHVCLLEIISFSGAKEKSVGRKAIIACNASSILFPVLLHPALCLGSLTCTNCLNRISTPFGFRLDSANGEPTGTAQED